MNLKEKAKSGDLLFYKVNPQSGWISRIIASVQLIRKEGNTSNQYSHVSLVSWDLDFQLEAKFPKTRLSKINWDDPNLELWKTNPSLTAGQRSEILYWAALHLYCWYDIGQIFFGLFEIPDGYSCTKYVGWAYRQAAVDLISQAKRFVGPNELIETGLIDQVI